MCSPFIGLTKYVLLRTPILPSSVPFSFISISVCWLSGWSGYVERPSSSARLSPRVSPLHVSVNTPLWTESEFKTIVNRSCKCSICTLIPFLAITPQRQKNKYNKFIFWLNYLKIAIFSDTIENPQSLISNLFALIFVKMQRNKYRRNKLAWCLLESAVGRCGMNFVLRCIFRWDTMYFFF